MIKKGDIVPLNLQLFDGAENMRVIVRVQDDLKRPVFEGDLSHVSDGLYRSNQFLMPDSDFVIASYVVFDGKKESKEYERAVDLFELDKTLETIEAIQNNSRDLFDEYAPKYHNHYTGHIIEEYSDGFMEGVINGTFETQVA